MAHAYTPGLKVSRQMKHRCRRVLPIPGDVLVKVGDKVHADDIVAQTFIPGDVFPINLANQLSMPPGDVPECLVKKEGDQIEVGELLAITKGIFGFFKTQYKARVAGKIESISNVTGQVIVRGESLPVQVKGYMTGTVVEVLEKTGVIIEAEVSYIQGIFGIGGETCGKIRLACQDPKQELTENLITEDMAGQIVIGGARMTGTAVKKAIEVKAAAVVSGGMDDQDLKEILGYDLGVAITGSEQVGISLVITEGFGEIAMAARTFELLSSHAGEEASLNGATQIRAGVMRPEIIVVHPETNKELAAESAFVSGLLQPETPVRIIRDPYFGLLGEVTTLPAEPQALQSGSKARVLNVKVESGEELTVPRANVEIIGD